MENKATEKWITVLPVLKGADEIDCSKFKEKLKTFFLDVMTIQNNEKTLVYKIGKFKNHNNPNFGKDFIYVSIEKSKANQEHTGGLLEHFLFLKPFSYDEYKKFYFMLTPVTQDHLKDIPFKIYLSFPESILFIKKTFPHFCRD